MTRRTERLSLKRYNGFNKGGNSSYMKCVISIELVVEQVVKFRLVDLCSRYHLGWLRIITGGRNRRPIRSGATLSVPAQAEQAWKIELGPARMTAAQTAPCSTW